VRTRADQTPAGAGRRHAVLGLAAALLAVLALTPATAAAAGKAPVIVSLEWSAGGRITVGGEINPHGLETTYEVGLFCHTCGPPGYQPAIGQLPAVEERRPVSLNLTGIKPGNYRFYVYAANAAGETIKEGELTVPEPPPAPHPEGLGPATPYETEISPAAYASAEHQAAINFAKTEAERQQAKEQQEHQHAAENAARLATEQAQLKQAEQRETKEATEREEAEHPACTVPNLKGDTLPGARHALRHAHCRLGAIHRPAHHHGTLHVNAQSAAAGTRLAGGARVALTLGAKGSGAKRASHRYKKVS